MSSLQPNVNTYRKSVSGKKTFFSPLNPPSRCEYHEICLVLQSVSLLACNWSFAFQKVKVPLSVTVASVHTMLDILTVIIPLNTSLAFFPVTCGSEASVASADNSNCIELSGWKVHCDLWRLLIMSQTHRAETTDEMWHLNCSWKHLQNRLPELGWCQWRLYLKPKRQNPHFGKLKLQTQVGSDINIRQ